MEIGVTNLRTLALQQPHEDIFRSSGQRAGMGSHVTHPHPTAGWWTSYNNETSMLLAPIQIPLFYTTTERAY